MAYDVPEHPCPSCNGEPTTPDCGLCGGAGTLPDATPVVREFLTKKRLSRGKSDIDREHPLYQPLRLSVMAADDRFQGDGVSGTDTWLDEYFLPEMEYHGITVTSRKRSPVDLVSALAYALARADLPTDTETSRDYAERLAPLVFESGYLVTRDD